MSARRGIGGAYIFYRRVAARLMTAPAPPTPIAATMQAMSPVHPWSASLPLLERCPIAIIPIDPSMLVADASRAGASDEDLRAS